LSAAIAGTGGLLTSSKSMPATPVSTPTTDPQPTGVISRIFGSGGKNPRPVISDKTTTGLQRLPQIVVESIDDVDWVRELCAILLYWCL